jgi:hypothetical protein
MVADSRPSSGPAVVFGGVRRSRHNYPVVLKHGIARPAAIRRKTTAHWAIPTEVVGSASWREDRGPRTSSS